MKKIISLFKRNYDGDGLVYDEVVPGAEWVIQGEGTATEKFDGTACMIRGGLLFKRYDRKATRKARQQHIAGEPYSEKEMKVVPKEWEPCEPEPDPVTGHWPGWVPVSNGPDDQWHRGGKENVSRYYLLDGTYELVGPKVQGNPYELEEHQLWRHGFLRTRAFYKDPPRTFDGLKKWLFEIPVEGIVWHHDDGRMVKIKRRDFGIEWPVKEVQDDKRQ